MAAQGEESARRRVRKFTPGRKKAFCSLIANGQSPTRAARELGVSRQAAYRQRAIDSDFAGAWDEAREQQADLYEDALRKAALDQGNIGGIIFGLKNLRPAKWRDRHEVETREVSINLSALVPPEALPEIVGRLQLLTAAEGQPAVPSGGQLEPAAPGLS